LKRDLVQATSDLGPPFAGVVKRQAFLFFSRSLVAQSGLWPTTPQPHGGT